MASERGSDRTRFFVHGEGNMWMLPPPPRVSKPTSQPTNPLSIQADLILAEWEGDFCSFSFSARGNSLIKWQKKRKAKEGERKVGVEVEGREARVGGSG